MAEVEKVGTILEEVFTEAAERGESPERSARRRVRRTLDAARKR